MVRGLVAMLVLAPSLAWGAGPPTVASGALSWGTSPTFAPFEFQKDGQAVGFDLDMMKELGRRLGLRSEMLGMDFAGIIPAVQAGRLDAAVSGMYITPAREEVLDFIPYMKIGDQMVVRAGNPTHVPGREALCGLHVAVAVNSMYEKTAQGLSEACTKAGKPAIDILSLGGSAVVALNLAQGRADAIISSTSVLAAMMESTPGTFEALGEPFNTNTRLGIGVAKTNPGLREALAAALAGMRSEGAYDALLKKWGLPASSSID